MKARLRKEMKAALAAMSPGDASVKSAAACGRFLALPEYHCARVILLYLPIPQEVDTAAIALDAWQHEKRVLAPRMDWDRRHMEAVQIRSLDDELTGGRFGIRQPRDGQPCPVDQIDLVVVPALAFDPRGGRLGRGAGFYDRFLSHRDLRAVACGLAFDEQVIEDLPRHAHDRPVSILVTDRRVLRFDPEYLHARVRASGQEEQDK